MKKNLTKITAALLIFVTTFLVISPNLPALDVAANSNLITQEDIDRQQQIAQNLQNEQQRLANQRRQLSNSISNLQSNIRLIEQLLAIEVLLQEATEATLVMINEYISQREAELEVLEYNYEQRRQQLATRLRVMHEDGGHNLLEAIFEADNVFELFLNIDLINTLIQRDRRDLADLDRQRIEIINLREELEDRRIEQDVIRMGAILRQEELEEDKADVNERIAEVYRQQEQNAEARRIIADEWARAEREVERIIAAFEEQQRNRMRFEGDWDWPAPGIGERQIINGGFFGQRRDPFTGRWANHGGLDISVGWSSTRGHIVAAQAGEVIFAGWLGGAGNTIIIDHGTCQRTNRRYQSMYAHNRAHVVRVGDQVARGQHIAYIGRTGAVTGTHLHFEIRRDGTRVNPMIYFPWHPMANGRNV